MPGWKNSRIEEVVNEELEDLGKVLHIVGQMQKDAALRILDYCRSFVMGPTSITVPGVTQDEFMEFMDKHIKKNEE